MLTSRVFELQLTLIELKTAQTTNEQLLIMISEKEIIVKRKYWTLKNDIAEMLVCKLRMYSTKETMYSRWIRRKLQHI